MLTVPMQTSFDLPAALSLPQGTAREIMDGIVHTAYRVIIAYRMTLCFAGRCFSDVPHSSVRFAIKQAVQH